MTTDEHVSEHNETGGDCIVMDKAALLALGGSYETAAVYSVLQAMTADTGFAVAGLDQIAYEAQVSYSTAHRATKRLRTSVGSRVIGPTTWTRR